jgi:hypothetical protein
LQSHIDVGIGDIVFAQCSEQGGAEVTELLRSLAKGCFAISKPPDLLGRQPKVLGAAGGRVDSSA